MVKLCVAELPTITFPKLTALGFGVSTPAPGVPGLPAGALALVVYPAQLVRARMAAIATRVVMAANAPRWAENGLRRFEFRAWERRIGFCACFIMARTV